MRSIRCSRASGVVTVSNVRDAKALALQADGKLVVAGQCESFSDFCALRIQPNGVLDASFGINGRAVSSIGSIQGRDTALALQADGKILLAGTCYSGQFCATRLEAVPFSFQPCSLDVDGDGLFLATTDALIYARVALGMTGNAVLTGVHFRPTATRNSWPLIRDYLVNQCGLVIGP